ncbi:MAG: hypothetical protein IPM33_06165 [Phycisphaerales bacterium]|nr:hypothetical protein [Phycisphaerales bacterium]
MTTSHAWRRYIGAGLFCLATTSLWAGPDPCSPTWYTLGGGVNTGGDVRALTTWDPDGPGPLPAVLVAGGFFTSIGGVAANNIAYWNGDAWQPLGLGVNGAVRTLGTWDPDGGGPLPALLIAGGAFVTAGGASAQRIARWDGQRWEAMGQGMNFDVWSITSWDPDGPGGGFSPQFVAVGDFTQAGGTSVNYVARWDGGAWYPFASGVISPLTAAMAWDPDGSGPHIPRMLVAGATPLTQWVISLWQSFNPQVGGIIGMTTFDPDAGGPLEPQLTICGTFSFLSGVTQNRVSRWNGSSWVPFGTGLGGVMVRSLTTWDIDGAGPATPSLVAGGSFTTTGSGAAANKVARWDGSQWLPLGTGLGGGTVVWAVHGWDPDGAGPLPPMMVAAGDFTSAGSLSVRGIAWWGCREIAACPGDFNGSGGTPDDADVAAFFEAWGNGDPRADLNGSGGTPDDADVDAFFGFWNTGC